MTENNCTGFDLQEDEIHVWIVFPEQIQDSELLNIYMNTLSVPEQKQYQKFYFSRQKHQYLVTWAMTRAVLSGYTDIAPNNLEFIRDDYGRPELKTSQGILDVRFNLSHTKGLVLCAVTLSKDIGADVEFPARKVNVLQIATRYFAQKELESLENLPEGVQRIRFFEYWTLKESYIKALGKGLSLPLDRFCFQISEDNSRQILFDTKVEEDCEHWQFELFNPTENHIAAISAAKKSREILRLKIRSIVPFQSMQTCMCTYIASSARPV